MRTDQKVSMFFCLVCLVTSIIIFTELARTFENGLALGINLMAALGNFYFATK